MSFIPQFIARDLMVVPSKQNVIVAFSPPISLTVALNLAENGPHCLLSFFAFYFVMCCLCYSVSFSLLCNMLF